MIKDYTAIYREANGSKDKFELKAQDVRRAVLGAAELIPLGATLIRVFPDPNWN